MAHVRQQVIAAVVTALTGLTTTTTNVSNRRTYPQGTTPALNVYWSTDETDYEQGKTICTPMRRLEVHVEGFTKGENESQANTIAEEVETAMYTDQTFGGLALGTEIGTSEILVEGDGESQVLVVDMVFNIFYRVQEGVPGTAA